MDKLTLSNLAFLTLMSPSQAQSVDFEFEDDDVNIDDLDFDEVVNQVNEQNITMEKKMKKEQKQLSKNIEN